MRHLLAGLQSVAHLTTLSGLLYLGYQTRERFRKLNQRTLETARLQSRIRKQLEALRHLKELKTLKTLKTQLDEQAALIKQQAEQLERQEHLLLDSHLELVHLQSLYTLPMRFPVLGAKWSIDGFLARAIVDRVASHRPRVVLELGCGVSTVLIAAALEQLGMQDTRHIAVDHLEEYLQACRENVERQGYSRKTEFWLCPLEASDPDGPPWYGGVADRLGDTKIDLVVVDGPPGQLHPEARRPAMHVLRPFLSANAMVFLDDAGRPEERQSLRAWREAYPELECRISKHGKRFAKLFLREAATGEQT